MALVASILSPVVARRILEHLALPSEPIGFIPPLRWTAVAARLRRGPVSDGETHVSFEVDVDVENGGAVPIDLPSSPMPFEDPEARIGSARRHCHGAGGDPGWPPVGGRLLVGRDAACRK
jgi:hypothetical protein